MNTSHESHLSYPINPHVWRRFKLAEANMLRFFHAGYSPRKVRRSRKWAREMERWTPKLFEL